ncbi:hypothetical protein IEQ44_08635 [Nocardioides sp. Y6]|uniref:Secreted protein n=1 Tax=Nocardioides malaquae TaxID=2773426 RepID=A0ABR9RT17_9ACTN|nr:hypothetical protein [Nocardioides malaquae]MBE7324718.1 hypothetical protein [Nocardioides malaquae]
MRHLTRRVAAAALTATLAVSAVGCSALGGKPSKDEYRDALSANMDEQGGSAADDAASKDFLDCLTDNTYDDLSTEAVQAVVDEDEDYEASKEDEEVIEKASKTCVEEMMGDLESEMPELPDMELPDSE